MTAMMFEIASFFGAFFIMVCCVVAALFSAGFVTFWLVKFWEEFTRDPPPPPKLFNRYTGLV